jgi:hypothetical protein
LSLKIFLEYVIPSTLTGLGVFQAAAVYNNLRGLMYFKNKTITIILACILVLPALWYFGTWNQHNPTGVIEGSQQAGFFFLSMLIALIATLILSSIINRNLRRPGASSAGLEALREATFFQVLRKWWTR